MSGSRARGWAVPVGLFALAVVIRLWASTQVPFPANEGSAWYVGVARNLLEGRGLVSDALWSYATPPLTVPKPAFELWMPMATLLAAVPMAIFGVTFSAAQLSSALVGAAVAPLAWWIAREAAIAQGLDRRRVANVALGSGLVAAILGPLLVAATLPDSMTPFLVFGVLVAISTASMLRRPTIRTGLALGALLGLSYLSRQEALELGLAYLLLVVLTMRGASDDAGGGRASTLTRTLAAPAVGGALVVGPWLLRNLATFGTLFPGQALENAYLSRNEEIFAYLERPTAASFVAQGPASILGHQLGGLSHDLVSVVLLSAFPVGLVGLLTVLVLRRAPAFRRPTALQALLVGGLLVFLVSSLLLPVATLWGTFLHASGPLLIGLTVAAMLGLDAAVAHLGTFRHWSRQNAWLAPLLVLALAAPLGLLQVSILGRQSVELQVRVAGLARDVATIVDDDRILISDHPVWLSDALDRPVIALPDEPPTLVARLAADFDAGVVVIMDERGRYPEAWLEPGGTDCQATPPQRIGSTTPPTLVVRLAPECAGP